MYDRQKLIWLVIKMVFFNLTVSGIARHATPQRVAAFNPRPALKRFQPLLPRYSSSSLNAAVSLKNDNVFDASPAATTVPPVPMTLLAGFLGTGKTTTLKHLLENTEGYRIGVIVNDVASVNIDAKLVASGQSNNTGDMVELQNGCACCSIADELFLSVEKLVTTRKLDAVVVELSGVADPKAIQNNWKMAPAHVRQMADIAKVVTVVDAQTFGTDFMTWDMAQNRDGWVNPNDPCAGNQKVSELLAEQVEAADVILVNKLDLATDEQIKVASKVAAALNEKALLQQVSYGVISPLQILGLSFDKEEAEKEACADPHCTDATHDHSHVVPCADDCDHESHKMQAGIECADPHCHDVTHDHSKVVPCADDCDHESHKMTAAGAECADPHCTDATHDHSKVVPCPDDCDHESHKMKAAGVECADPHCTDASHDHSKVVACADDCDHESHKMQAAACNDPHCDDPSHKHHSHSHDHAASCSDPHCDDPSHSHSHSHEHATSTESLGISNFVYKATRPFHSMRLLQLLNRWPVPKKDMLDMEYLKDVKQEGSIDVFGKSLDGNPFLGVLRSKGFTWLAPTQWTGLTEDAWRHDTAMYLSHAGRHMSIDSAGKWWASVPREQMDKFFEAEMAHEKDRIIREDFVSEEFGDRRQELVFIGMDVDQEAITAALNECLLTDEEMTTYRQQLNNYQQTLFTAAATNAGLMDTMGTQHIDQAQ